MITDETRAYLADQGTPDQQQLFQDAADRIHALYTQAYPDSPEDMPSMTADQLSGAAQYALGDATLTSLGREVSALYTQYLRALDTLQGAMVAAEQDGMPLTRIAEKSGLSRTSVYKRLGR